MDINSVLPLIMNKSGVKDDKLAAIMKMAGGEKPDISTVMNMAMEKNKSRQRGLYPVACFTCNEILGKLVKYFICD